MGRFSRLLIIIVRTSVTLVQPLCAQERLHPFRIPVSMCAFLHRRKMLPRPSWNNRVTSCVRRRITWIPLTITAPPSKSRIAPFFTTKSECALLLQLRP